MILRAGSLQKLVRTELSDASERHPRTCRERLHLTSIRHLVRFEHCALQRWPPRAKSSYGLVRLGLDHEMDVARPVRPQADIDLLRRAKPTHHVRRTPQERPKFAGFSVVEIRHLRDVPGWLHDQRAHAERPDAVFDPLVRRGVDQAAGQFVRTGC